MNASQPARFAPPQVYLGHAPQGAVHIGTPQAMKVVYTLIGGFFLAAVPYGLLKPSAMRWEGVDWPTWTAYLGLPVCAVIGWFVLSMVWRAGLRIDKDVVAFVSPFGRSQVSLTTASGIRVIRKVTTTGGVFHTTTQVVIDKDGRPAAMGRSEFTTIDDLLALAVRWWVARPELVTDAQTAQALTAAAHKMAAAAHTW